MKKIISIFLLLITLLGLICSCDLIPENTITCKVNFYVDGELYKSKTVSLGKTVTPPNAPEKQNEIFVGWTLSYPISRQFDFSKAVTSNLNLYASYVTDAESMSELVTTQTVKSIVTIENRCHNSLGIHTESNPEIAQGSGVVIDISGGYCYVLTNNHVVEMLEGFSKQSFVIEDPWGNKYDAKIYKKPLSSKEAVSYDYDLALLCFKYHPNTDDVLQEIAMGNNPKKGDNVVALGTPQGLQNAITYGSVNTYDKINPGSDESLKKVNFDVIVHTAYINHGSSGGALINTRGELVGINFAGYNDGTYGFSIPIEKVKEFLDEYVY